MISGQSDPGYSLRAYEQLRQEALASAPGTERGHGLALFVMRGLSAWLHALNALVPRPIEPARSMEPVSPGPAPSLSPEARSELTNVLADMVLACSQEAVR